MQLLDVVAFTLKIYVTFSFYLSISIPDTLKQIPTF